MHPSSPLSLLLFLQLSTAFPVLTRMTPQSQECLHSSSCTSLRSAIKTFALSRSKPSDPRNPHFPEHQKIPLPQFVRPTTTASSNDVYLTEEGAFDNVPTTPSKNIPVDEALSAVTPLTSAYLQSLAKASDKSKARPSMPTSALPDLRKEDARKYWEGGIDEKGFDGERKDCENSNMWPGLTVEYRARFSHLEVGKTNDFIIVGVVVLYLMVVCALELAVYFGRRTSRRGQIYLEDDETHALIVKRSKGFYGRGSRCIEKCALETEHHEYKDDETVVDEDFDGDTERKV